jgi:hypothetical protein
LERKLKKKDQLRNKIDPAMYNYPKIKRSNTKGMRSSVVVRSSIMSRSSVMSTASEAPVPPPATSMLTPRAPPGTKPTGSAPPSRKNRKLTNKPGIHNSVDDLANGEVKSSEFCDSMVSSSPARHSRKNLANNSSTNSSIYLSQSSLAPSDISLSPDKISKKTPANDASLNSTTQHLKNKYDQSQNFSEKVKRENKDLNVEVLPTTQYYSSPDKLCKTVTGDVVVVNGDVRDDPSKTFFHPIQKEKVKNKAVKKKSNYVADIMRIGLSNTEIEEREKSLKLKKQKLGIPKDGYIEGIRNKNNANLFDAQRKNLLHRQNLNRRINEFKVVRADLTKKAVEKVWKRELLRPAYHKQRLEDLSVEDDIWRSQVMSAREKSMESSIFAEQSSIFRDHKLNDVSHVSDFNHIQPQSSVSSTIIASKKTRRKIHDPLCRQESLNEKENFEALLKQKVLEKTGEEIKSTILSGHNRNFSTSCHGDISPRAGEISFRENQSRMEEVSEVKQIKSLEEQKWIFVVIDLIKVLAAKRKVMSEKEKLALPEPPNAVFLLISCLLRLILTGVAIDKNVFYLSLNKIFSKQDHSHPGSLQIVSTIRNVMKISPQEHYDFLIAHDIEVCHESRVSVCEYMILLLCTCLLLAIDYPISFFHF